MPESKEDVRAHVREAIRQGIAAGLSADDIETILDDQRDDLERVRAFDGGDA